MLLLNVITHKKNNELNNKQQESQSNKCYDLSLVVVLCWHKCWNGKMHKLMGKEFQLIK